MKVLYLLNKVYTGSNHIEHIQKGLSNDNAFYGMFRVRRHGIETTFLEIEQFFPRWLAAFLRKHVLNIFWVHLPLFPLFFRYDIIFSSTAYGSLLVKVFSRIKKPKWVILDFNISGSIGGAKTMRQKILKWAISRCDGIVAISRSEADTLKNMFPHLADRIIFLYEGVDTNFYKPNPDVREESFIFSGGLDPSRDFKTLIDASKDLDVQVRLATKPEQVKHLEPFPPNVSCKLYSRAEMVEQYARAKIVVIGLNIKNDSNDSMGTFSVEDAMSMGKAVVVTKTKSLASYIEDGVTGVFVPPHNPDAMRKVIDDLLADDQKRREIGHRARLFAVENFDAEIFAKGLAHYLKKLDNRE